MAVLYALDRRGAREDLVTALREYDIVLLDRYIASNAAYGAARLRQGADGEFVAWVRSIEVDRYELPLPDLQIYLGVTPAVAAARAAHRERTEEDRARDNFESDTGLQERCAAVYHQLAEQKWLSDWLVTDGTHDIEI
jgi:dTMP kinase